MRFSLCTIIAEMNRNKKSIKNRIHGEKYLKNPSALPLKDLDE